LLRQRFPHIWLLRKLVQQFAVAEHWNSHLAALRFHLWVTMSRNYQLLEYEPICILRSEHKDGRSSNTGAAVHCTAATASLATLPHDEDADKRSTQHSAYDQIALQRVRLIRTRLIRTRLIRTRLIRTRLIRTRLIRTRLIRTRLIRTRLVISALDRSLCPRNRFDENENSRARLGCQSSGIVLGVHVVL
jgi:hypothetical protein